MVSILFLLTFLSFSNSTPYSVGYSNAINYFPITSNPATYGDVRNITTSLSYSNVKHDLGLIRRYRGHNFMFFYPTIWHAKNVTYAFNYDEINFSKSIAKVINLGASGYHLFDMEDGYLDLGVNFKKIIFDKDNLSKNNVDVGFLVRKRDYIFGLSFVNIQGSVGGYKYGIPKSANLTGIRLIADYSIGFALSRYIFDDKNSYQLSLSASQILRTYRYGYFRLSNSLSFSSSLSSLSFGIFYNRDVWEFSFSISGMLNNPRYFTSSVGITLWWSRQDVETEYERIVRREIKYRKDLLEELGKSAKREGELRKQVSECRSQIDELNYKIENLKKEIELKNKEMEKLSIDKERIVLEKEKLLNMIKNINEKQQSEEFIRKQNIKKEFDREMDMYRKLKLENPSKQSLINYLKRIISTYQDTGIDISDATSELIRLTKE